MRTVEFIEIGGNRLPLGRIIGEYLADFLYYESEFADFDVFGDIKLLIEL